MADIDRRSWKDQWDRIDRFLERFKEIRTGCEQKHPSYHTDIVYATFQNIWHLKDWLKNDASVKANDVEAFCKAEPSLVVCADLANGSKHLSLNQPKGDPKTNLSGGQMSFHSDRPGKIALEYSVEANGATQNAWAIASDARTAWERYLHDKGLL